MKRLTLFACSVLPAVCLISCGGVESLLKNIAINVETSSTVNFEIPAIAATDTIERELVTVNYVADVDQKIKMKDPTMSIRDIKSLSIVECSLTLNNGDIETVNNFSSFETFAISLAAGSGEYSTFFRLNVPDKPSLTLSANPMTIDLSPIFRQAAPYRCKLSGKMRRPTTERLKGQIHIVYELKVEK
jgi:hypothetical protein